MKTTLFDSIPISYVRPAHEVCLIRRDFYLINSEAATMLAEVRVFGLPTTGEEVKTSLLSPSCSITV